VNLAIPVSHLQRFLARPEIVFTPPTLTPANQHQPVEFRAGVIPLLPSKDRLDLELVLSTGAGKERRVAMQFADGSYHAKAIPFPAAKGTPPLRLEVKYDDGSVCGSAEDASFTLGKEKLKLSQVHKLTLGPKSEAELRDGRKVAGGRLGLEEVPVKVGGQSLRLSLARAAELTVTPPEEVASVSCILVARLGKAEVGRLDVPLYREGVSLASLKAVGEGKFFKPQRSTTPVSYLRAVSSKGDYIGQGKSYSYGGEEMTVQRNYRGVFISVDGWRILFGGPGNRFLQVGEYPDAKRHPFSGDSPGIEFTGKGRGANRIAGKFVVWELEVKDNQVVRLAVDFIQHCEERMPPLYGMIRVNSTYR
jgi:hypothetical protein